MRAAELRDEATPQTTNPASPRLQNQITEWYVNTRDGLEQGFTVSQPPVAKTTAEDGFGSNRAARSARDADAQLRVALQVTGGLRARLVDHSQAVELYRANGQIALRYDHLSAQDATGQNLPAHLEAHGREINLVVDAVGAVYPVTIDPMFTQLHKLTASDGATLDEFGEAGAISGDTVVAGSPVNSATSAIGKPAGASTGAAYVFDLECGTPPPPPPTFNVCLKDDTTGNFLQWNSTTGAYLFTHCGGNDPFTLSGVGTVGKVNGILTLTDKKPDRNITAGFNTGQLTGTAVVTVITGPGLSTVYHISDTNPHPVCSCAE